MESIAIEVENLTKIYRIYDSPKDRFKEALGFKGENYHKNFYALDNVSFKVKKGEVVGIVGKNGSGKSTILKILTGVLNPTSGNIKKSGKVSALLELGAGFNQEYTGMENIYLNATMMHISREEIEKRVPEILNFADIGDYINQPVKTYSSGMFVRLAFAVAINVDPDILIVDEALAVGDVRFQIKCMKKFHEFMDRGKTILFVTHDINAVKNFCSRAIWINNGKIIMDGKVDDVVDHYYDFIKSDLQIDEYFKCINNEENTEMPQTSGNDNTEIELERKNENTVIDVARIDNLRIYDGNRNELQEIKYGDKVIVRVDYYVSDENFSTPVLGIAIKRIDGEYICGLNTKLDGFCIPWKKGKNSCTLTYDGFNLIGGQYYFDVGLFDQTALVRFDYRSKIKSFFVRMDYIAEGIVVLKHHWINDMWV